MSRLLSDSELECWLAQHWKERSERGADVRGDFAGDLGRAMQTLQKEIDELHTTDVLGSTAPEGAPLTPEEALAGQSQKVAARQLPDALWDAPATPTKK
jgi:hypothetical protein